MPSEPGRDRLPGEEPAMSTASFGRMRPGHNRVVTVTDLEDAGMSDDQRNVVTFLKSQHDQIKRLFAEVEGSAGKRREEAFRSLRVLLAVHETAEEEFVHPRVRKVAGGEGAIVDARLREENDAKKMLADLEKVGVDDPDFAIQFAEFKGNV